MHLPYFGGSRCLRRFGPTKYGLLHAAFATRRSGVRASCRPFSSSCFATVDAVLSDHPLTIWSRALANVCCPKTTQFMRLHAAPKFFRTILKVLKSALCLR